MITQQIKSLMKVNFVLSAYIGDYAGQTNGVKHWRRRLYCYNKIIIRY